MRFFKIKNVFIFSICAISYNCKFVKNTNCELKILNITSKTKK